jgi:hypothetical protein
MTLGKYTSMISEASGIERTGTHKHTHTHTQTHTHTKRTTLTMTLGKYTSMISEASGIERTGTGRDGSSFNPSKVTEDDCINLMKFQSSSSEAALAGRCSGSLLWLCVSEGERKRGGGRE